MNNRILGQILAAYEERQQENQREESRRQAEIAEKAPEIEALARQRHEMILSSVRGAFAGGTVSVPEKRMAEYNEKIAALLRAKGYPPDYLGPVRRCAQCGDTGYVYENSLKRPCECLQKAYRAFLSQEGGPLDKEKTFERFDPGRFPQEALPGTDVTQREYMEIVRRRCRQFADGVPDGPAKTLLLHGGSGLGKTYLLHCVANAVEGRGMEPIYETAYDLLACLKNAYFSRGEQTAQEYFDAPLLLIDDLGMEPMIENITVEQIYNLLNARLSRGLPTVVSTNLSRTELQRRYTERVSSRLLDTRTGMAIPFLGKDIRLLKNE